MFCLAWLHPLFGQHVQPHAKMFSTKNFILKSNKEMVSRIQSKLPFFTTVQSLMKMFKHDPIEQIRIDENVINIYGVGKGGMSMIGVRRPEQCNL